MDCVRVGRLQSARFYPGSPDRLTKIRWYKCLPDALVFPFPHTFGFNVWDDPEVSAARTVGFLPGLGTWDSGLNHGESGTHFHGRPEWFLYGIPDSAPDVDARCLQWCGLYSPALGLSSVGGVAGDSGAAALGMRAAGEEATPLLTAALGIAAGWVDSIPTARGTLALSARGIVGPQDVARAAVPIASGWTEAIPAAALVSLAGEAAETLTYAASVGIAAAWYVSEGSYAASVGIAAAWYGGIVVAVGAVQTLTFAISPNVNNGLRLDTVLYDTTGGFSTGSMPWAYVCQATGVYHFGLSFEFSRKGTPIQTSEDLTLQIQWTPGISIYHLSNPPYKPAGDETWQEYISEQALLNAGDGISLYLVWSNVGGGTLDVSFRFWIEFLGPLTGPPPV
jgi:hypothetical protein